MEAIILAGGLGRRLKSVISDMPKPMAPIGQRPFLDILLSNLSKKGITRVVLSVGYRADIIMSYFGDKKFGIEIVYTVEDKPLGTGGAIKKSLQYCNGDHVFIFNGDTFTDIDLNRVESLWFEVNGSPIIVGVQVNNSYRYGLMQIEKGCIIGFNEKGKIGPGIINAGCYLIGRDLFKNMEKIDAFSFEVDFLLDDIHKRDYILYLNDEIFIDIGIPEDYKLAHKLLKKYIA